MGPLSPLQGTYFPGLIPLCYIYLEYIRCDKDTKRSVGRSVSHSVSQSVSQPFSQSVRQSVTQSLSHSVN